MLLYKLIRLVPPARQATTRLTPMGIPGGRTDPLFIKLKGILNESDARHVFQALKNGVGFFLTVDNGILARRNELERFTIQALKPTELVNQLG